MTPVKKVISLRNTLVAHKMPWVQTNPKAFSLLSGLFICLVCSLILLATHGTTFAFPDIGHPLKIFEASDVQRHAATPAQATQSTATSVASATPVPTPAPTVTAASGQAQKALLAAPISPFPVDVRQQVGVLQAHDRFFYGGNPNKPEIALTFDDGPDPPYTNEILAVLKKYNIKASFFWVGHHVVEHPDLVKQAFDEGHTVGIHSWDHVNLPNYSAPAVEKQINNTAEALKKITGVQPTFFRPPYGAYNSVVLSEANKLGLSTFLWNDVASDWLQPGASVISARIINSARYGSIVLLHDGDGDHYNAVSSREQTVQALPTIITTLQARGYRFVSLDQMVADLHK